MVGSTPLAATVTAAQVGNTYIVDLHLSGTLDGNAHDTSFDRDTTFDGNAPAFDAIAPQVIDRRVSTVSSSSADCGTDQPGAQTQHWALIPGVKSGTIDVATIGLNPVSYTSVTGGAPEAGDTFVIDSLANQELVTVLTVSQSQVETVREYIRRQEEHHRDRPFQAEFIALLKDLDAYYPPDCTIRLILDNHSAHLSKETRAYLATRPNRFKYVLTPTHGSWLNIVETLFGKMTRTFLRQIRVGSKKELKERILLGIAEINEMPVVHRWKAFEALEAAAEAV